MCVYAGVCVCDSDSSVRGVSRNFAFIFKFLFVCSLLLSILYCCCMFVYKELSVVVVHLLVVFFFLFILFVCIWFSWCSGELGDTQGLFRADGGKR